MVLCITEKIIQEHRLLIHCKSNLSLGRRRIFEASANRGQSESTINNVVQSYELTLLNVVLQFLASTSIEGLSVVTHVP